MIERNRCIERKIILKKDDIKKSLNDVLSELEDKGIDAIEILDY